MNPKLYLESTIPSYLTARPSRDTVLLVHQQLTRDWWDSQRSEYELFVSELVLNEIGRGDASFAELRLELVKSLPLLAVTPEVDELAMQIMQVTSLPTNAIADATHVAITVLNGMDFLLTWNCRHLANPVIRRKIEELCRSLGFDPPIICTPDGLLGYEEKPMD